VDMHAIVVGTYGSSTAKGAVAYAANIARETGATLHLVHAVPNATAGAAMAAEAMAAGVVAQMAGEDRQRVRDLLDIERVELTGQGLKVESHAVDGPAADAIVKVAEAVDADMVVVGSKGMQGARRILGSVPNSVAHHAPCTVTIVKTC